MLEKRPSNNYKSRKTITTNHNRVSVSMIFSLISKPPSIYLFKFNNGNTKTRYGICSKLTAETPEQNGFFLVKIGNYFFLKKKNSDVVLFIVNFEQILQLFWCFYCWLWTKKCQLDPCFVLMIRFNAVDLKMKSVMSFMVGVKRILEMSGKFKVFEKYGVHSGKRAPKYPHHDPQESYSTN